MRFAEQPRRMIQAVVFLAILLVALSGCQGAFKGISTVTPAPSPTGNPPLATSTTAQANSTPPATLEASPLPEATGVLTATATAATGGTPAQGSKFLLFGPFHLPPEDYGPPFTGAFASLDPSTAQSVLDAARKAGFHLIVNLAGKRQNYQAAGGAFSVDAFKQQLDAFSGIDLSSYVADGTLIGHMMFDEPFDPSNWNGVAVPNADIEAAAAYSKQLWPTLPVGVGGPPSFLAAGAPWKSLDFGYAQYTTRQGDLKTWLSKEVTYAHQAHLGIVIGMNILGGNNRSPVTAEQLKEWGQVLASEPSVCGFLMWRYDQNYLQSQDIASAMSGLAQIAESRTAPACKP